MASPNTPSNYESPIEELWFNNFLKKRRLEREVEVLEIATQSIGENGFFEEYYLTFTFRYPVGKLSFEVRHAPENWEYLLMSDRYLELRRLELKNHSLNMRRVLMDRKEEVAVAYDKAFISAKDKILLEKDKTALLMGRERNRWDTIFEMRKGIYRRPFYLGRILTNPLNRYSERTDAKDYVNPLFGDLICVRKNIALKGLFNAQVLRDLNNLWWFTSLYWNKDAESIDSKILKMGFIDPLKKAFEKEDNFQQFVKERAEMVDKTLMPTKRD